jgi:hypothetical protein
MMRESLLSDKLWRGLGTAARAVGEKTDAYRPADRGDPLRPVNRYLRLPAAFIRPRIRTVRAGGYGEAFWEGVFDAAYTQPGDYLVRSDGSIWFVAAQPRMQAPLCVQTLRRLSFTRPSGSMGAGANGYGGVDRRMATDVLTDWPAAMATPGMTGQIELAVATTLPQAVWSVLLPPLEWLALLPGDMMSDDLGRAGVVDTAECTELGWRLVVRQSTS